MWTFEKIDQSLLNRIPVLKGWYFSFWNSRHNIKVWHCVKSARIRSYSCPHTPYLSAFSCVPNEYECGKMRTRITPNTVTFYKVWKYEGHFMGHFFTFAGTVKINFYSPVPNKSPPPRLLIFGFFVGRTFLFGPPSPLINILDFVLQIF